MEWEYFYILEESRCIGTEQRFNPFYITLIDRNNEIVAIAPLFERTDATCEFGISGLITEISSITQIPFERGIVGTIPFTPVPAYSFLIHQKQLYDMHQIIRLFLHYIDYICDTYNFLSSRFYFIDPFLSDAHEIFTQAGYVRLATRHFLWGNMYKGFDEFLDSLGSHRRRNIRRELKKLDEMGVHISLQPGYRVDEKVFDQMYGLYVRTWKKHMPPWIRTFLNRQFFLLIRPFFRERCLFSVGTRGNETMGMAIFFEKKDRLFGRYWGSYTHIPFLHFAVCYYKPIMYAIEKGIKTFDPGFGGYHKEIRGFEYIPAYHFVKFHGPAKHFGYMTLENLLTKDQYL